MSDENADLAGAFWIWELHNRLHSDCTLVKMQVDPKEKVPLCGAFAELSSGLEPETPSLSCAPEAWPPFAASSG
jgi:hypothetical protein